MFNLIRPLVHLCYIFFFIPTTEVDTKVYKLKKIICGGQTLVGRLVNSLATMLYAYSHYLPHWIETGNGSAQYKGHDLISAIL